jgi:hypothetical protein
MDEETKVEGTCACGSDKKTEDCCGAPVAEEQTSGAEEKVPTDESTTEEAPQA